MFKTLLLITSLCFSIQNASIINSKNHSTSVVCQVTPPCSTTGLLAEQFYPTFPDFSFSNHISDNRDITLRYTELNLPTEKLFPSVYVRPFGAKVDTLINFDSAAPGNYQCILRSNKYPYGFQALGFVVDEFGNTVQDSFVNIPTMYRTWQFRANRWYIVNPQTHSRIWSDFLLRLPDFNARIGKDFLFSIYRNGVFYDFSPGVYETPFYTLKPSEPFLVFFKSEMSFVDSLVPVIRDSGFKPITQTLNAGWNLIANPFHFPISVKNISASDSVSPLFSITDSSNNVKTYYRIHSRLTNDSILPYEGYFIFASRAGTIVTFKPYTEPAAKAISDDITISISNSYQNAIVGVSSSAYSIKAPPMGFQTVHSEGNSINIKKADKYLNVVPISFYSNMEYRFNEIGNGSEVILFNLSTGDTVSIVDNCSVRITNEARFTNTQILIGDRAAINHHISLKRASVPSSVYSSGPFPNPFNPVTRIRYGIPFKAPSHGFFAVYNTQGVQLLKTDLPNFVPGHHEVVWDARDDHGRAVSTGYYIGQIKIGTNKFNFKMAVVK